MYAMWWNKPLTAHEPFILRGDWVEPLCAYMYMSSELSGEVDESFESQTTVKTLFAFLNLYSKAPEIESVCLSNPPADEADAQSMDTTQSVQFKYSPKSCSPLLREKQLEKANGTAFFERRPRFKPLDITSTAPDPSTLRRWHLAAAALTSYPSIIPTQTLLLHASPPTSTNNDLDTPRGTPCTHLHRAELLHSSTQNWPYDDLLRSTDGLTVGIALWHASFIHGFIHASTWNDHFPFRIESLLWRLSALYVGFCGALWIIVNGIARAHPPLNRWWEDWMDGRSGKWWIEVGLGTVVVLCGGAFMAARAYLVVEAFASIRSLPKRAYETPDWTEVFPHF
jgi:hypothetical protein